MVLKDKTRWILDHWLISSGEKAGQRYSFKGYEFLFDIVQDDFENVVVQKSAQCGISELCVAELFYRTDTEKGNILYVFPAETQMREFSNARIKNAVATNPYLLSNIGQNFNASQFQYKRCFVYCRGSQNRRQMISVDASMLIIDEVDECDGANIVTVEKRLGASTNPIKRKVSTPTFPNQGINYYYLNESDRRSWKIKCEACGEWQTPNFFLNIMIPDGAGWKTPQYGDVFDIATLDFRCVKCQSQLDRYKKGEWVAELPSLSDTCRGYAISKLFASPISLQELWKNYKNIQNESEFWNSDLGLPYYGEAQKIELHHLDKCREAIPPYRLSSSSVEPTTMGVDVGKLLHYQIGKKRADGINQIINFGVKTTWEEIKDLINKYKVKMTVIDGLPPHPDSLALARNPSYRHKVKLAFFSDSKDYVKQSFNQDTNLNINRILFCDSLIRDVIDAKMALPIDANQLFDGDYYKHLTAIQRIHTINKKTGETNVTHVNPYPGRQDHFFFAAGYQRVASELAGVEAKQIMSSLI